MYLWELRRNYAMVGKYLVYPVKTSFYKWVNYSYVIVDNTTRDAVIIDPAWELEKIEKKLELSGANLSAIFLTHSHYDHVNLVAALVKKYCAVVYISEVESVYYNYTCRNLKVLKNREKVKVGDIEIEGILTPGHTSGSMCYLLQDSLFTGDTIFSEGCGICCEDGGSAEQMYDSIQCIKSEVDRQVKIYPGHSFGRKIGATMKQLMEENIYFQIDSKEIFVKFRMRKSQLDIFGFK